MSPPPPEERTVDVADPLMSAGMERVIPLRFVQMLPCTPGPGCADIVDYQDIVGSVQNANFVWRAAGVQFTIGSVEHYDLTDLIDQATNAEIKWDLPPTWPPPAHYNEVRDDFLRVFPSMPSDAWLAGEDKTRRRWLKAVSAVYSSIDEVIVWVTTIMEPGIGGSSAEPESGRSVRLLNTAVDVGSYTLAHELGHILGIRHTFSRNEIDHAKIRDPETGFALKLSDKWDLVYKPGTSAQSPHTYYTSRTAAQADESSLELIDVHPCQVHPAELRSCIDGQAGQLTCHIGEGSSYWQSAGNGDPRLKGLAFTFVGNLLGANVMSYSETGGLRAVSDSQIALARKYLRWDVPFTTDDALVVTDGHNTSYPLPALSGLRPYLGQYVLREPVHKLDFDGDGRRDIGVWFPPENGGLTGSFTVLLSGKGFSQASGQFLHVDFGGFGDVPVPADYNGDGRTDLGLYQPGGGPNRTDASDEVGRWHWCPTASPAESTSCLSPPTPIEYGMRYDTPLPGLELDGAAGDELTVYRPSDGSYHARNVAGSFWFAKTLGALAGSVPLPGLYDCDLLTDLAIYEPGAARFKLRRSEQSWNTTITRNFDADLIAMPDGDGPGRSGAMPLASFTASRSCTIGGFPVTRTRRSFAAFFPGRSEWHVLWRPIEETSVGDVKICQYGDGAEDQPIAGLDRNYDRRTDMAFFRASSFDGPGHIYTRLSVASGCNGQDHNASFPLFGRVRRRVWAVADMTGDAKAEILMVLPDTMRIQWFTSQSDYTWADTRDIGTFFAEVL